MKTAIERNTVQRMGVQSEGNFRIKATGKAFRILSDGLYSDKITAIIRELSCNAYDAHVEAGNLDKPFKVHLPTQFEPHFSLRDYGVGLSHDDVIQVYTTYFESTKTDSNDYIGCLGLGSKSPFSYVDNFSIVSFYNGEKRTYNAFMNEDGIPSIALMATEKTKEHNGIEVSFAVSNNDFRSFYSRVPNVFRYFKIQPEITGHKDIEIETVEYSLKGNGWGIRNGDQYGNARAIMGNVAYPLSDMDSDKVSQDEWSLISSPIDITFDIGELEVAASRENISFNKATIQNVQKRLAKLVKEVSKKVEDELNNCPTLWDARVRAVELSSGQYSSLKSVFNVGNITYKGQEIEGGIGSSIVGIPKDLQKELSMEVFSPRRRRRRRSRYSSYGDDPTIVGLVKDPQGITVKDEKEFRFFIKDIDRGSHVRAKQVINESDTIDTVWLLDEETGTDAIQRLMDVLGYEGNVERISTIDRPKRASRGTADYNPMNAKRMLVYQLDEYQHDESEKSSYWTMDKVDVRHGGIYVPMSRYKVNGEIMPDDYVNPYLRHLKAIGEDVSDIKIVGVKTALQDKVESDPDWITLSEYTKDKVAEFVKANELRQHFIVSRANGNASSNGDRLASFIQNNYEEWEVNTESSIAKYVELLAGWKESVDIASKHQHMVSWLGIEWEDDDAREQVGEMDKERAALYNEIVATYPMLKLVSESYNYEGGIVKDYIALIDRTNGLGES